jgi:hypothetical protein
VSKVFLSSRQFFRQALLHHTPLKIANLITVIGDDTTVPEVCQRVRCNNFGVKGNNTYQIVYTGNLSSRRLRLLDVAMDGAGHMRAYGYGLD